MASVDKHSASFARAPQARTRAARASVLGAAREVFAERGYAGATIELISRNSGVPAATVYRLFGTKIGILSALLDVTIAGDDDGRALADRPSVQALVQVVDARSRIDGFVQVMVSVNARLHPVYRTLVQAADTDPEADALLERINAARATGQGQLAQSLQRDRLLKAGLSVAAASDIIHGLMSPELYWIMTYGRGWSPQRYRQWLSATLADQLLP